MHYETELSAYLALQWAVLPLHYIRDGKCSCGRDSCNSPGKHPVTLHGVKDATTDWNQIKGWWTEDRWNIGIATGKISNLTVVDIDPRNGGMETLAYLPPYPVTLCVKTGGNGYHFYFTALDGLPGKLGKGIDIKKDGGYVVAPPSNHASGEYYQWFNNEAIQSPEWVLQALETLKPTTTPLTSPDTNQNELDNLDVCRAEKQSFANYKLADYAKKLSETENERMIALNNAAYYLGGIVARGLLEFDTVHDTLYQAAVTAGLGEHEVQGALSGSISSGMQNPVNLSHVEKKNKTEEWFSSCMAIMEDCRTKTAGIEDIENPRLREILLSRTAPKNPLDPGEDWSATGLARRLKEILQEHYGDSVVYSRKDIYAYKEQGNWETVDPELLDLPILWSGARNPAYDKPLQVSAEGASMRSVKNILSTLAALCRDTGAFDNPAPGIYFRNGRYWQGKLHEHEAKNRSLFVMPHDYDPNADCTKWDNYLDTVLPSKNLQNALHEFIGLALFGETHSHEKALVLYGGGSNGKSTTLDVIKALFDPRNVTAVEPADMAKQEYVVALANSKINIVADMSRRDLADGAPLKKVISGEQIRGKILYKDRFDFYPRTAIVLAANELPQIGDHTKGFSRRFLVLPFTQEIKETEDIKDYYKVLVKEAIGGLIRRAVEGYHRVDKRGYLLIPEESKQAMARWKCSSDQVMQFLEECTDIGSDEDFIVNTDLYMQYKAWNEVYGGGARSQLAQKSFTQRLNMLGVPIVKKMYTRGYRLKKKSS